MPALYGQMKFEARDTLAPQRDSRQDARDCIKGLIWQPSAFQVQVTAAAGKCDQLVSFPSPKKSGSERNDRVSLEWFQARDENGKIKQAPAMLIVHETGSNMAVGRTFAVCLRAMGYHAFMIHLPYYGERRQPKTRLPISKMMKAVPQAVADIRRARDAIAALPKVQRPLALQGTSLGGFLVATAGALDDGFDRVYIVLAGADLFDILQKGKKDAAEIRRELAKLGLADKELRSLLNRIEPGRLAHRLPVGRTWLYSARKDTIVPLANARKLAQAANLKPHEHRIFSGDHYSCVVYLPHIISHIDEMMKANKSDNGK